ncbi:MAG: DnaA/Hda family protein [Pseudomonadota bacterium]
MQEAAVQIPFDLGHRTALGRDDFLVSPSNQDAVAWLDLWPEWPAPALIMYGPVASGKSHLGAVWYEQSHACCIDIQSLSQATVGDIADQCDHLILDDADNIIGNLEREKGLFHLYNIFKEERRSFLMILEEPPVRRTFALPDLASRLRAAPAVSIREPDDQLLSALLVKLFNDRQLRIGADVIHYIVPRIERSFQAAQKLVMEADTKALVEKRPVSIPLIRDILNSAVE